MIQLFPKYFQDRLLQTLRFLQAYISASRHNTTTVRVHYSQTQDVSNVTPVQAVSSFPYDICPLDLDPTLLQTLTAPSNLLTSYTGLQPLIQQAMEDHSIDPENYGKGAKGNVRAPQTLEPRDGNLKVKEGDKKASPRITGSQMKVRESNTPTRKVLEKGTAPPRPHGGNLQRLSHHGPSPKPRMRRPPPKETGTGQLQTSDPSLTALTQIVWIA